MGEEPKKSFWSLADGSIMSATISFSLVDEDGNSGRNAPDHFDQISSFQDQAGSIGLSIDRVICDGAFHRCSVSGKSASNTSGSYWLNTSSYGVLYGWARNWVTGADLTFTGADEGSCRTYGIDYRAMQAEISKARAEYEKQQEEEKKDLLTQSMRVWETAIPCEGHAYLTKKKIPAQPDMKVDGERLLVPAYNENDDIIAWQSISPDGKEKKYCRAFPSKSNAYYRFIGGRGRVFIAEGMATAYAVHKATGGLVYAAFDAGRLSACAKMVRDMYPAASIIIAADNDLNKVGQNKGSEAAQLVNGYCIYPETPWCDWWDVWNDVGDDFIKKALEVPETLPVPRENIADKFSSLPEPPYPVNRVAEWVLSTMPTPHKDIAIMSAWAMVAAFSGRKDSFLKNPPSIIMTLLAINGAGKDTLSKSMSRIIDALMEASSKGISDGKSFISKMPYDMRHINSFRPTNPSMGTAQMAQEDNLRLSGIRLTSEAGLSKQSKAGDGANVRASALQNSAKDAYGQLYYPATKGGVSPAFGVPYTIIDESTPETYLSGMLSDVASGAAARSLMIRIDVSKSGTTNYLMDDGKVPDEIVNIFHKLVVEAVRGEKRRCNRVELASENDPNEYFISDIPVSEGLRRRFGYDERAEEIIKSLSYGQDMMRNSNKTNDATLEWAYGVRRPQLVFRVALIAARTRAVVDNADPVVTGEDMEAAIAFVDECHRVGLANSGDYDNPYNRAAVSLREWIMEQLAKGEPSSTYKRYGTKETFNSGIMPYGVLGKCGTPGWKKILNEICGQYGKSPIAVFKDIAAIGAANKYWQVSTDGMTLKII